MLMDSIQEKFSDLSFDIAAKEWVKPYYIAFTMTFYGELLISFLFISKYSRFTSWLLCSKASRYLLLYLSKISLLL